MTKKIYLEDSYQFYCEATIVETREDEKGVFVILDQTIFYPKGGGQPSDQGVIRGDHFEINVIRVAQVNNEIRHYITSFPNEIPKQLKVLCLIDKEKRLWNGRYHTAAHLIGNIVENLYPHLNAVKGHSFPGEAYVEFSGCTDKLQNNKINVVDIQNVINESLRANNQTKIFDIDPIEFEQLFYKLPYRIPENEKFRVIQIGDMLPVPCGGTHLASIGEIGGILISKIKVKNTTARISYEVI